jgi:hypothetical protein
MFADDTIITLIDSVYQSLQNSIGIIYDWCARNSLLQNPEKNPKGMIISPSNFVYNTIESSKEYTLKTQENDIEFTYSKTQN